MRRVLPILLCVGCTPRLYTDDFGETYVWQAPENMWPQGQPPEGLQPEGFDNGLVVPDFLLRDQHGDEVSLWQFHSRLILLDVSTMWCAPCQDLAPTTQTTQDHFGDELAYVTVMQENLDEDPVNRRNLNEWADAFGIEGPILADPDQSATGVLTPTRTYPVLLLIDRDLRAIRKINPATAAAIDQAIEDAL